KAPPLISADFCIYVMNRVLMALPLWVSLQRPALDAVHCSLRLLASSASRLQVECRKASPSEPGAPAVDYQLLTQQVIQCAYDIAKAAKQLVTITTREKKQ
ncbi:Plasma membrane permease, mediates uptake of glycerophosphoinositol and glycerophosphocholine, partial [Xenoophorus captivus]